jgi:hypothetical protein
MAIIKRADKGSALTYNEMDANFDAVAPRTSATGAIEIPVGTTGQQPASPVVGQLRFNTQLNLFEGYFETLGWSALAASGVSGEVNQDAWAEIAVSGQTNVVADQKSDLLTFAAGTNISITTDAATDTITFSNTFSQDFAYASLTGAPTNVSTFTNDSGYLTSETTTTLTSDSVNQKLVYTDEAGTANDVDLSWAIDDTNLARITSGTVAAATGIATFTRDDATSFTVDFSALFDDTNLTRITSGSFNNTNGELTLTRSDATTVPAISLDGRYLTSYTVTEADVTQHQAALSITESQISDLAHYTNSDVDTHINVSGASSGQVLSYNGVDYAWIAAGGDLVNDTTPQLGGDLDVNSNNITGAAVNIITSSNGDIILNPNGTGNISFRNSYNEKFLSLSGLSGTEVIDVSSASHFYGILQGNTTFVFNGETATTGQVDSFTLYIFRQTSFAVSINWPSEVLWPGGLEPDVPAQGETDIYVFTTINNGTSWYGFQAGDAMA